MFRPGLNSAFKEVANGGWGFGKSDWTDPTDSIDAGDSTGNFSVNGGLVGGTIGFNWWADGWVIGLEGDFDGSWMDGKTSSACDVPNCETKNEWCAHPLTPTFYMRVRAVKRSTKPSATICGLRQNPAARSVSKPFR